MSKKKKGIAAAGAAVFCAAVLAMFGISGDEVIEMEYEIAESGNMCEMAISAPDDVSFDIAELLCNGQSVTKTVLPDGRLRSLPIIFTNLDNLEFKFYRLGEVVGIGKIEDGKLKCAVKDGAPTENAGEGAE